MKTTFFLKLIVIYTIILVLNGCNREENRIVYLPEDFKNCFDFPIGSWWQYAINDTLTDTLVLDCIYTGILKPYSSDIGEEAFTACYKSSIYGNFDISNVIHLYDRETVNNGDETYVSFDWYNWTIYYDIVHIENPIPSLKYFGDGVFGMQDIQELSKDYQFLNTGYYFLERISDTLFLNKTFELRVFTSVEVDKLPSHLKQNSDKLPPYRVYYAHKIGLIRKEMYNGDVWELKEYFINHDK